MKISGRTQLPVTFPATLSSKSLNPLPDLDLQQRPSSRKETRRRIRNLARVKRTGASVGKRSRPETPLLKWKVEDRDGVNDGRVQVDEKDELKSASESSRRGCRRVGSEREAVVSARKLAAGLWRLQLPVVVSGAGSSSMRRREDQLGHQLQPDGGHISAPILHHHDSRACASKSKEPLQSRRSISDIKNGILGKLSNSAMEGATKWDPICLKTSLNDIHQNYNRMKLLDQQVSAVSVVSALEAELEQARVLIEELETERRTSKKKLEHFLRKVNEEKSLWRSREHDKIRAFIGDVKAELSRERKSRQRVEIINSKLVNELEDVKLSTKRFMQDYEKERKTRELMEEVCDELAKEIGEDKAEVEALKGESMKLREEVEEERRMLQMAEVWREERVQMKLVDAKVALEEKYSQMNKLVAELESFLRSRSAIPDLKEVREAVMLRQAAANMNIQDFKEFSYEPPNPDDIFSIFEDVNCGELHAREIEPCNAYSPASHASNIHTVTPEVRATNKYGIQRHSSAFVDQNDDIEDESGWETVSHVEDQGSCYSPEGSTLSVNKNHCESNVSGSETEWEQNGGTPISEISEVCSIPAKQVKKVASITRLWRSYPNNGDSDKVISVDGMNGRRSNSRMSNGSIVSPDRWSAKGGHSPPDLKGQWSSPDTADARITRGKKGCIPLSTQKNNLKTKLIEAKIESQKVQLRHVLKQKI